MIITNFRTVKAVSEGSRQKTNFIHRISLVHAKAECLVKELKKEHEERDAQEKEDTNAIRALHLRVKSLRTEKDDLKKNLTDVKNELKGTQTLFLCT